MSRKSNFSSEKYRTKFFSDAPMNRYESKNCWYSNTVFKTEFLFWKVLTGTPTDNIMSLSICWPCHIKFVRWFELMDIRTNMILAWVVTMVNDVVLFYVCSQPKLTFAYPTNMSFLGSFWNCIAKITGGFASSCSFHEQFSQWLWWISPCSFENVLAARKLG